MTHRTARCGELCDRPEQPHEVRYPQQLRMGRPVLHTKISWWSTRGVRIVLQSSATSNNQFLRLKACTQIRSPGTSPSVLLGQQRLETCFVMRPEQALQGCIQNADCHAILGQISQPYSARRNVVLNLEKGQVLSVGSGKVKQGLDGGKKRLPERP